MSNNKNDDNICDVNINFLKKAYDFFAESECLFLKKYEEEMSSTRPYKGISIIHNVHITMSTVCKIHALMCSGADITVTATEELKIHKPAYNLLVQSGIKVVKENKLNDRYDIALDCCGGLINKVIPRYGSIELTQTGAVKYQRTKLTHPVISVDDSLTKRIENLLGTGESFIRAFLIMTNKNIYDKKFVVFGFGKVGRGIVKALLPYTNKIVVIDKDFSVISYAVNQNLKALHVMDPAVKKHLKEAFCTVTATGVKGFISEYFDKSDFSAIPYLTNMGSEDEYGDKFSIQDVLFNKSMLNFSLSIPTKMKFLDPVFYLHNASIENLLKGNYESKVYPVPRSKDFQTFVLWMNHHIESHAKIYEALIWDVK